MDFNISSNLTTQLKDNDCRLFLVMAPATSESRYKKTFKKLQTTAETYNTAAKDCQTQKKIKK